MLNGVCFCRPGYRSNYGRRDGPPDRRSRRSPPPRGKRRSRYVYVCVGVCTCVLVCVGMCVC